MTVPEAGESPLVLVADDVPANVELLVDQLRTLGFRTVSAHDGPSALAAAREHRPDLAILDVAMPAGDLGVEERSTGFEVCRRIKREARTAGVPVIFVTALNDSTDRVKAIEAGGDDFLTKPHNRMVLGARVRSLLKLRSATEALQDSYRKLRELEKVRDDLMKMIVHDLKTPLAAVLATVEMLRDGDFGAVSEVQAGALADTQTKAEDLLALIEDLLELARLEESHIALDRTLVSPAALLSRVVEAWQLRRRQEGATLQLDIEPDVPSVLADERLLERLLNNLFQNALVHGGRGVHITVGVARDGDGARISVGDNGPGIAAAYHELIFRKFETVRLATAPRARSSGLGLSFCKLVAEAHGGRIWVQSAEGKGSTFFVVLPSGGGGEAPA